MHPMPMIADAAREIMLRRDMTDFLSSADQLSAFSSIRSRLLIWIKIGKGGGDGGVIRRLCFLSEHSGQRKVAATQKRLVPGEPATTWLANHLLAAIR